MTIRVWASDVIWGSEMIPDLLAEADYVLVSGRNKFEQARNGPHDSSKRSAYHATHSEVYALCELQCIPVCPSDLGKVKPAQRYCQKRDGFQK